MHQGLQKESLQENRMRMRESAFTRFREDKHIRNHSTSQIVCSELQKMIGRMQLDHCNVEKVPEKQHSPMQVRLPEYRVSTSSTSTPMVSNIKVVHSNKDQTGLIHYFPVKTIQISDWKHFWVTFEDGGVRNMVLMSNCIVGGVSIDSQTIKI